MSAIKIAGQAPEGSFGAISHALIKIGQVIDWWRPDPSFPVPAGFKVLDGSAVSDPESPLNGLVVPNSNTRYIRGGDLASMNNTGGNSTVGFGHTHGADHTHFNAGHSHAGSTNAGNPFIQGQDNSNATPMISVPHTHPLVVSTTAITTSGASSTNTGSSTLTTVNVIPSHMEAIKIMRIK